MKALALAILCLLGCAATAQNAPKPPYLMEGYGDLHHPVSTAVPEAQQFFDQGLRLVYAFNHEEAARSFEHAAELDPKLAMAWWGVAFAVGPNYNMPVDPEHEKVAADAIDKARALAASAPQVEQDYIDALAKRFTHQASPDYHALDKAYADAMRALYRGSTSLDLSFLVSRIPAATDDLRDRVLRTLRDGGAVDTSGKDDGSSLLDDLRNSTGLDDLNLTTDSTGAAAVTAGRYITDKIYLGVQAGASGKNRVTVNLDLAPGLKANAGTGADGDSGVGVLYEQDY